MLLVIFSDEGNYLHTSTACPRAPNSINRDWINQVQPNKHFWWHWIPVKHGDPHTTVIWYSATCSFLVGTSVIAIKFYITSQMRIGWQRFMWWSQTTSTVCPQAPSSINRDWINQVLTNKHFWRHGPPKIMATPIYNSNLIQCKLIVMKSKVSNRVF